MTKTMNQETIGKIEYLDNRGNVVDCTEYEDHDEFAADVKAELSYGVSIKVTYVADNGQVISKSLMNDHDGIPKMGRTAGDFMKVFEKSLESLSKVYNITDEPVEVRL